MPIAPLAFALSFAAPLPPIDALTPGPRLVGTFAIPGTALDLSGLNDEILPGVPHARLGGFGSGIDYSPATGLYIAVDDRGPADGAAHFRNRLQTFKINLNPATGSMAVRLVATTLLSGSPGRGNNGWFVGATGAPDAPGRTATVRHDPEALRLTAQGTVFVSDEYAPAIDEFDLAGQHLRRLAVPPAFSPPPRTEHKPALPPRGRQDNRGFEGLALTPSGSRLVAIPQSPLLQDGALDDEGLRKGLNIRVLALDPSTGDASEFVYPLDAPSLGVSEILAVSETTFITIERDGRPGETAAHRRLYLVSTDGATNVAELPALPASVLPPFVQPLRKRLLIDLLAPAHGLAGSGMPEKIEGLTFGPDIDVQTRLLIVTSDNDFVADAPSWFWAFAVPSTALEFAPHQ
ncbi:MAG: esterase-like activity of phytase family protein [Phycisphaerales bacterium]